MVENCGLIHKAVDYRAGDLKRRESGSVDHPLGRPTAFNVPDVVFHSFTKSSCDTVIISFTEKFI